MKEKYERHCQNNFLQCYKRGNSTEMKKILIVNNNMHIGGIQKSLVNLLNEVSDKYETELLLFADTGELMDSIPKNVKITEGGFFTRIMGLSHKEAKDKGIVTYLHRSFWVVMTKLFKTRFSFGVLSKLSKMSGEYDCAVSFMQNNDERMFYGGCVEFVLNAVKSPEKICFIHCDFPSYGGNNAYNRKMLERFDKTAVVSDSVGKRLLAADPALKGKIYTVHNCCNYDEIKRLSDGYKADYTDGSVNLFSAARLRKEKGIIRMIPILKRIKDRGIEFVWRIAGTGEDLNEIRGLIKENMLGDNIILLGELANPYPYFKKSDIVLVPSYNEAAPMVYDEAAAFGTPVFTTDTTSAVEMIADRNRGWVCENTDDGIEKRLFEIMHSFKPHKNKCENVNNERAVSEFIKLIG